MSYKKNQKAKFELSPTQKQNLSKFLLQNGKPLFDAKEFEDNAPEHEPDYIDFINKEGKYTPIECSLELDYEFANESI